MTCKLRFHELAIKKWEKLAPDIRDQIKKKLAQRLKNPHIPSAALWGMENCYKIKLRKAGYRLIYRVEKDAAVLTVMAVGKRDKLKVYTAAQVRVGSYPPHLFCRPKNHPAHWKGVQKKSSQPLGFGRRMTRSPSRSTYTSVQEKRNSAGRRTAWLRPFMNTLLFAAYCPP